MVSSQLNNRNCPKCSTKESWVQPSTRPDSTIQWLITETSGKSWRFRNRSFQALTTESSSTQSQDQCKLQFTVKHGLTLMKSLKWNLMLRKIDLDSFYLNSTTNIKYSYKWLFYSFNQCIIFGVFILININQYDLQ